VGDEFRFFVPAVYQKERDTLNFTLSQKIGEHITLSFSAENLTNSERQTVFRSDRLSSDVVKTSHTDGIDFSLGISADFKF
jgi:outer membrane receptor protein involved in Fe transport